MMGFNVNSYDSWWKNINESEINHESEFGSEGGNQFGLIIAKNSVFKKGIFTGADRFYEPRGEVRPSKGYDNYDYHIYYSPNEFDGWENSAVFNDYDTRGLNYLWKELSMGKPVVILTPGNGTLNHNKSAEHIAYEEVYKDILRIPEYIEILKLKRLNKLGSISIPKEITMSLKSKLKELEIDKRTEDIFDQSLEDPTFIKNMVKKSVHMGLY